MSTYLAPDWNKEDTRFTMIDALHSNVDGKLWAKTSGGPDPGHANKLYQFDLTTKTFHEVLPAAGKRDIAAYGLVTDLDNNVYGLDNNPHQKQIWRTEREDRRDDLYRSSHWCRRRAARTYRFAGSPVVLAIPCQSFLDV